MDGYETTRKIREYEVARSQQSVPARRSTIVAMTANAMKGDRQKCMDAGMDDFLAKPVYSEDLDRMLQKWLSKMSGEKESPVALEEKPAPQLPVSESLGQAVVDLPRLMDCVDNDLKELRLLLEQYLPETVAHLKNIEESINRGAVEEMSRRAHRCGGSSATVGMRAIAVPLRAIEQIGLEQTVTGAKLHLQEAWKQLNLICDFLKNHPETASCYPTNIQLNA